MEDEKKPFREGEFNIQYKEKWATITAKVAVNIEWPPGVTDHCNDCAQAIAAKALGMAYNSTREKIGPRKPKQPPEARQEVPVE